MANVPYTNLNYDGLKVVIVDPSTGEFAVPNVVASSVTITASALPTGAATSAKQDTLQTAIGSISDAAWSGTGNGSVIAILKAIFLKP